MVQAQLEALANGDLESSLQFASPANRRSHGTRHVRILADPTYNVLIDHSQHQIVSALQLGSDRYACRVSVRPSEASLCCLPSTAHLDVGQRVRISSDAQHVKRCFDFVQYEYSELMDALCGEEFQIVCHARENCGTNMVGLPSPDGSQDGVWYFPVTLFLRDFGGGGASEEAGAKEEAAGEEVVSIEETAAAEEAKETEAEEHYFRFELRRQSDHNIEYDIGDMMVHARYGYRGAIVGFDDVCMETEEWMATMGVDKLSQGRDQPFYQVLVDARDRAGDQITYVAQENILRASAKGEFPSEPLEHRLLSSLLQAGSFDEERCRYEPVPKLREIYPADVRGCWMVDAIVADEA